MQKIEYIDTDKLKNNPDNPRQIDESQFRILCESLKNNKDYFEVRPIICNKEMIVFAGNMRLRAAKHIGMKKVPTVIMDIPQERQNEIMLRDNRSNGEWAWESLANTYDRDYLVEVGFTDFELGLKDGYDDYLEEKVKLHIKKDDIVPELPKKPQSNLGDLYELGNHKVFCGDSTKEDAVSMLMEGVKAELLFTSPPYSDIREYHGDKDLDVGKLAEFIQIYKEYTKYQVVNLGIKREKDEIVQYWDRYISVARNAGYKLLSWNVWNRQVAKSVGQMTAMFPIEHEWIFVFGTERKQLNLTVENKTAGELNDHTTVRERDGSLVSADEFTIRSHRELGTVNTIHVQTNHDIDHPAIFPLKLPEAYILAMTNIGQVVIDPFLGSGSTLIAAEKTGRICYGMELDPQYVDVIVSRYVAFTGNTKIKKNSQEIEWLVPSPTGEKAKAPIGGQEHTKE